MLRRVQVTDDDPLLVPYRQLKASNPTRWAEHFIAEGDRVVERLLARPIEVLSVVISERWLERFESRVSPETPLLVLPDAQISELVGFQFHRGALACARRPRSPTLENLIPSGQARCTLVACPEVVDPENLGTILRCSAALGVDAVLVGAASADPYSRRVLRVSMGTAFSLPLRQSPDLAEEMRRLRAESGVEWVATVLDEGAEKLSTVRRKPRQGLVFGSEGHGLSPAWLELCERRVTLPMSGGTDSLNVGVAAGVFLYHFLQVAGE